MIHAILPPFVLPALAATLAGDWPQYHGAHGDRASAESIALTEWQDGGPPRAWRVATPGGFSSFSVLGDRAFTLITRDGVETVLALATADGSELWAQALSTAEYDRGGNAGTEENSGGDGPRSTPSIDQDRVYVFDANLVLHCLDAGTGESRWKHDLIADHEGRNVRWQNAASPLVDGELVFVAGGGEGKSLMAFDKRDGTLAWAKGNETITHATPIAATIHGQRQVIFYVHSGLIAVEPTSGTELWRLKYPFRISSAASPVVWQDVVYLSAGYGVGAGAYRIVRGDDGFSTELLWRQRNKLMNHWSTPVCIDGYLYGMFSFKKYGEGPLACVDIRTGETRWSEPGFGPGNAIAAANALVALADDGRVVLAEPTPEGYRPLAEADVLDGKCWSTPVLADGQLYVRSTTEAVRLDLGTSTR